MVTADHYGTWQFQRLNLSCNGNKRALWQVAMAKKIRISVQWQQGRLVAGGNGKGAARRESDVRARSAWIPQELWQDLPSQSIVVASNWPVPSYPHFYQKAKCMILGLFFLLPCAFNSLHLLCLAQTHCD